MKYLLFIFFFITCPAKRTHLQEAYNENINTDWELAKDKDGIQVYTRLEEGTDVKAYKAITEVQTDMKTLEKLIEDVDNYPSWHASATACNLIKQLDQNIFYYHYYTDLPYPLTDRDIVLKSTKKVISNRSISYQFICTPDFFQEINDCIRIKKGWGKWKLTSLPGGKIQVIFQFLGDPGGNIPTWVVNLFIVDGPYQTLANLRELVK